MIGGYLCTKCNINYWPKQTPVKKADRFDLPRPATDSFGNVIGDSRPTITTLDDPNNELSSTTYKRQKLTAAYEGLSKHGYKFTSYEERLSSHDFKSLKNNFFLSSPFSSVIVLIASHLGHFVYYSHQCMTTLYISELSYPPMTIITTLAMLAILVGATLSITGFSVTGSVVAQMTGDNATMSGNMTGGNVTGGNTTGSISSAGDPNG